MAAQVGTFIEVLGGKERTFSLLSQGDLATLTSQTPSPTGELIDVNALDRWSKHVIGSARIVHMSFMKLDPAIKWEDCKELGSVMRRTQVASRILIESLLSGEEPETPKAPGQENAAKPA